MFDFIAQAAEPVITGLDVVKAVDAFYQNAWLMLVVILGVLGVIIGIVMPLIIQHRQLLSFDKIEKRLKDEIEQIKNETQESIQEEVKVIKSKFVEIQKDIEKQIDKETRLNRAEFYSQMGTSFSMGGGQEAGRFFFFMFSAKEYATLKNYEFVTVLLNRIISKKQIISIIPPQKDKAKSEEVAEKVRTRLLGQVDKLRKILEEQGVINRFSELLAKVDDFCRNFVLVADKPEPPEEPKQERA